MGTREGGDRASVQLGKTQSSTEYDTCENERVKNSYPYVPSNGVVVIGSVKKRD